MRTFIHSNFNSVTDEEKVEIAKEPTTSCPGAKGLALCMCAAQPLGHKKNVQSPKNATKVSKHTRVGGGRGQEGVI